MEGNSRSLKVLINKIYNCYYNEFMLLRRSTHISYCFTYNMDMFQRQRQGGEVSKNVKRSVTGL